VRAEFCFDKITTFCAEAHFHFTKWTITRDPNC
jgi:hypothetical protein